MQEEQGNSNKVGDKLDGIINTLNALNEKIEKQGARIDKLEGISSQRAEVFSFEARQANVSVPRPPMPKSGDLIDTVTTNMQSSRVKMNMEENIGGTWFARIGITALILGVSFLLKYAFDNNWIGETGRVIMGIMIGLTLLALGEKFIRKYFNYGQIITGGGIAVLYLSIFAAFDFYHLIGQLPAFFIMMLITAVGITLSLRYDAISLGIVAIMGGFVTPILISTGQNNQISLFSYILILDLAILVVSIFKKWRELNFIGFIGTLLIFVDWADSFYTSDALGVTMFFLTTFFLVYSISSLIYNLVKKESSFQAERVLTLMTAAVYFSGSYALLNKDYHAFMPVLALILAIYYFLGAYLVKVLLVEDENLYNFLALLTVGFITLAIPLQFNGNVVVIGWLIEALLLFYVGVKNGGNGVKAFGVTIFSLALFKLFFLDQWHLANSPIIFNRVFLTFFFAVVISYVAAYLFKLISSDDEKKEFLQPKQLTITLLIVANILTVYAVSHEINFYHDQQIRQIEIRKSNAPSSVNTRESRNVANTNNRYKEIERARNWNSVELSIFWLIYSIILLTIGITGKYKGVRVGGLLLLVVAILKLFFYDLWNLGTLYRIISSISLGTVLLSISFTYQKYKDKIKDII